MKRSRVETAERNHVKVLARKIDAELYDRPECRICGGKIPKKYVLAGVSTRTVCSGECALKAVVMKENAKIKAEAIHDSA